MKAEITKHTSMALPDVDWMRNCLIIAEQNFTGQSKAVRELDDRSIEDLRDNIIRYALANATDIPVGDVKSESLPDGRRTCPCCKSVGFDVSVLGGDRCTFCDGTEGGNPPPWSDRFKDEFSDQWLIDSLMDDEASNITSTDRFDVSINVLSRLKNDIVDHMLGMHFWHVPSYYDDVREFHKKFGLIRPIAGAARSRKLTGAKLVERIEFMQEELTEFTAGVINDDYALQADSLVDLVYVALGTAVMMALPFDELWYDVHEANMRKVRGTTHRGHAVDVMKPNGWVGPQTLEVIERCDGNLPPDVLPIGAIDDEFFMAVEDHIKTTAV